MPKVTLRTLQKDVLDAAQAAAEESIEGADERLPEPGTSVEVTRLDVRLWRAALRLAEWKAKRRKGR